MVANVGRADQVLAVPGNDKERSRVFCGFDVKGIFRRAFEVADHDMTALGTANVPRCALAGGRQHPVHPGPGRIDDAAGFNFDLLTRNRVAGRHGANRAVLDVDTRYFVVGQDFGAGRPGRKQVLEHEPLDIRDLRVVIACRGAQAFTREPRLRRDDLVAVQHVVIRHGLAQRQQVIGDHAEADDERTALRRCENRDDDAQRRDQVRCNAPQRDALAQRLEHQRYLAVLEVAQSAVDQAARNGRCAAAEIALLQHHDAEAP